MTVENEATSRQEPCELNAQEEEYNMTEGQTPDVQYWKVAAFILVSGMIVLLLATSLNSSVLALIGLGLTFWGALFFFVKPPRYVRKYLLNASLKSSLETIDNILTNANYQGKGVYLPPYPKNVYLPRYLEKLRGGTIIISREKQAPLIVREVFLKNPDPSALCIAPPGSALEKILEKRAKQDFSKIALPDLCETITELLVEEFELVKECRFTIEKNEVHVSFSHRIYNDICSQVQKMKNIHQSIGCPLCSAIACALAKCSGKPVVFESEIMKGKTVELRYTILKE